MFANYGNHNVYFFTNMYTPYTRDATFFFYIADQKQANTSRAEMDCGKLTVFLLLQTLKRGVAS